MHLRPAAVSPVLALLTLLPLTGCTSTDETATAAVPSTRTETAAYCRDLDRQLPQHVDGLERNDPNPRSALTAGWGDPAIILRCGVPRPGKMDDMEADGLEVNGVGWLQEQQADGSFRFTSTLRRAYVEVTLPKQRIGNGAAPLTDFAAPVRKAVPQGIAD
jgi:hypothetical protein